MIEFNVDIECPFCWEERTYVAAFDFHEADNSGCLSKAMNDECQECAKSFWFRAYVEFNTNQHHTSKRRFK